MSPELPVPAARPKGKHVPCVSLQGWWSESGWDCLVSCPWISKRKAEKAEKRKGEKEEKEILSSIVVCGNGKVVEGKGKG